MISNAISDFEVKKLRATRSWWQSWDLDLMYLALKFTTLFVYYTAAR